MIQISQQKIEIRLDFCKAHGVLNAAVQSYLAMNLGYVLSPGLYDLFVDMMRRN
jgi:hypothetical protein